MDKPEPLTLEIPYFVGNPPTSLRAITWCPGHWAELMFALRDRGLGGQIAPNAEALNRKFIRGESDPCWEACNSINVGALEIFGPDRILNDHKGCPVCAFTQMINFIADGVMMRFGSKH